MGFTLHSAMISDIGLVRANNEDSAHAGKRLIAVADGIGGMPAGELASEITIRALAPLDNETPATDTTPAEELRAAVETANSQIREAAEADEAHGGMGTTVTAVLLTGNELGLVHVGDSRGYLFTDGQLVRLTKDDTYVQTLVDSGMLTADQARSHPRRSVVTQAVQGIGYEASSAALPARPGDRFMLCSDGLSDYVDDDVIGSVLRTHPEPGECAQRLVSLALAAGSSDNVTVVVADVETTP